MRCRRIAARSDRRGLVSRDRRLFRAATPVRRRAGAFRSRARTCAGRRPCAVRRGLPPRIALRTAHAEFRPCHDAAEWPVRSAVSNRARRSCGALKAAAAAVDRGSGLSRGAPAARPRDDAARRTKEGLRSPQQAPRNPQPDAWLLRAAVCRRRTARARQH